MTEKRAFKVDARALLSLGRESIKDHTTALLELIKNSYDADADHVEVEIIYDADPYIRIADDGDGMDSSDIDTKWLRIGFSEKRQRRISPKGRRETGEKGIGRLSADRLGAHLRLQTMKLDSHPVGVDVNWNEFDVEGKEIGAIRVMEVSSPMPRLPKESDGTKGTEILISQLRQEWNEADISTLENELSTLVPPEVAQNDFAIWLKTERDTPFRRITSSVEQGAELEFRGSFDSSGQLTFEISERPKAPSRKRHTFKHGKIQWAQHVPTQSDKPYALGRFSVTLAFFLRSGASLDGFSLGQLREYLDVHGGVRIYRDKVRVKPYGDPNHAEGDWLGLSERKVRNPAGAGRKDYRIAANQLVGAVHIGRDTNPALADSAAREGLVHGDAYSALHAAVFGCVMLLETTYHERFVEKKKSDSALSEPKVDLPSVVGEIKSDIAEVARFLSNVDKDEMRVGSTRLLSDSVAKLEKLALKVEVAEREIDDLASQTIVYRGLATVGIASAVFGHETESALAQAKISTGLAYDALDRDVPKIPLSMKELHKARDAVDRVHVWGQFALSRVKKDKRRRTKVDISSLVEDLVAEMNPIFEASTIDLQRNIEPGISMRGFAMDFEAILVNLLTNAYHAASLAKRNRQVLVTLKLDRKSDQLRLSVADSGPGITKEHLEQIWTPLFSTRVDNRGKPTGTGLGLTIVRSITDDMSGTVLALAKGALGGASVEISVPSRGGRS